jgi:hypothetical protein
MFFNIFKKRNKLSGSPMLRSSQLHSFSKNYYRNTFNNKFNRKYIFTAEDRKKFQQYNRTWHEGFIDLRKLAHLIGDDELIEEMYLSMEKSWEQACRKIIYDRLTVLESYVKIKNNF